MFSIYDGRKKFYQWDIDRKLIINDKTIKEVHFANCLCADARKCIPYAIGDLLVVDVPNELLTEHWDIRVWGYDSGMTKHCAVFDVEKRTKPADYIYTPKEMTTWEELNKKINNLQNFIDNVVMPALESHDIRITALESGDDIEITIFNEDATKSKTYTMPRGSVWNDIGGIDGLGFEYISPCCDEPMWIISESYPDEMIAAEYECPECGNTYIYVLVNKSRNVPVYGAEEIPEDGGVYCVRQATEEEAEGYVGGGFE